MRTLDDLYPPAALGLPVNTALIAPRLPDPPAERENLAGYRDHYGPFLLGEKPVGTEPETIALIDKAFPHTLYDLMLLVGRDDILRTCVGELPDTVLTALLEAVTAFTHLVSDPAAVRTFGLERGRLSIGWNFDPTRDRDNGQWWDKRLHVHCNAWHPRTCRTVRPVPLAAVTDATLRRSLIDPAAYLAHQVLLDAIRTDRVPAACRLLAPDPARDAAQQLPVGLKVRLPGFTYLATHEFRTLLRLLHGTAVAAYRLLRATLTDDQSPAGLWRRPALRPVADVEAALAQLPWLTAPSRSLLLGLRMALRDVPERQMRLLRHRSDLANRFLTLDGPSYNLSLFTPDLISAHRSISDTGELYLVMQIKTVSSIGSSPALGGAVACAADRTSGPAMTSGDRSMRAAFQSAYAHRAGFTPSRRTA
ncbi:hypothetical protein LN042_23830 [Kitasatospora sp. RB6PN24]|uniref:hypothetical protein n=1 Tax=Kitasatospora humi TaxID=2893891 RepID=UPI001E46F1E4|nr:hypothetical protein [Kitasatospora humi]MCC9310061.1 hypothetical protein [Kitasatospora humi]